MPEYDFKPIEKKWHKKWEEASLFRAKADPKKPKFFCVEMFPYPSGSGLHMGHFRNYVIADTFARFKRMQGFSVLYPTGFDAFGLPAENAAIQRNLHPRDWTFSNIETMRKQMRAMNMSYDWSREVVTCVPEYYRWNQWLFLKMYEKGLAYKKKAPVNWCPSCETVLANEQVVAGKCWRASSHKTPSEVEVRDLEQWFLKITAYADELLRDIDTLKWPERVKTMQRNWIGRSEGTLVKFQLTGSNEHIHVFTTRPDTIFGCTFIALAPDHPLALELSKGTRQEKAVKEFVNRVVLHERRERTDTMKEGVFVGTSAVNPATGEEVPVYVTNFVLMEYGTGAVMCVPAHDQRDFDFALSYKLPIKAVIKPKDGEIRSDLMIKAYEDDGVLVNSGEFTGISNEGAKKKVTEWLQGKGLGRSSVQFKLRDWLISRQRYWGTPIPIIYCEKCGTVPVSEKDLPVKLPEDVKFTGEGNPLAQSSFVKTKCPKCAGQARRETDTMDTFVDSSWYFFRYASRPSDKPFDSKEAEYWVPIDFYIGGIEHAILHLLYARFFTKVTRDMGLHGISEPFARLFTQGMLLKDGTTMSKSKGNTVDPETIFGKYGVDASRIYMMSVSMPESEMEWNDRGVPSSFAALNRVWNLFGKKAGGSMAKDAYMKNAASALARDVTTAFEALNYPAAITLLTAFSEDLERHASFVSEKTYAKALETLTLLLTPFAPHICEELWARNHDGFANVETWPKPGKIDEDVLIAEEIVKRVIVDVEEIKKLVKIAKPKKVMLFVAPEWKRVVYKGVKEGKQIGDFMKDAKMKKYGDAVVKYVNALQKKKFELRERVLSAEAELAYIKKNKKWLEEVLDCRVIIEDAAKSKVPKAASADVHKPGILLE